MNPLTRNTMNKTRSQKKGRNNYAQTCRLPGIFEDIFAEVVPNLTEKKPRGRVRNVNVNQAKGRRRG